MNISKENKDALNASIKLKIEKADYEERVDSILKDYRKKANINGFRPGKVPMGLIKKQYYMPIMVEEVNKLISENLTKYLVDEKLNILGEPLPSETEKSNIDWENDSEFEFTFDIGMVPEFEFNVTAKDKFTFYKIKIDDEMRKKYIEGYTKRFGSMKTGEKITENEFIKVSAVEVDDAGTPVEDGISMDESSISLEYMKDEKSKKLFAGKKVGDKVVLDVKKAFPNEADLAGFLQIQKEEVANIKNKFELTITTISVFEPAEINQELFDKVYGAGNVKSEEEFKAKIDEEITVNLKNEGHWKFNTDVRETYTKKLKVDFPDEFLKRWLVAVDKEKNTPEKVEQEFPMFIDDLKWQLIKDKIVKEHNIEVSEEEVRGVAKDFAKMQFMQYGLGSLPEEHLEGYVNEMFQRDEERRRFYERKVEEKVYSKVKDLVKVDEKEISSEKFNKMVEK